MPKPILAITTCRVSTPEQELNGSLNRQAEAVIEMANELEATIPEDGQWSGSVSSKSGTNVNRNDLKQMLEYCRKNRNVKYLIVHEVDRFMRSVDELFYFEVDFREEVGVKIIYASQPELNTNDYHSKLLKALEAFKGEGSNVERIRKSISGDTDALKQGRYPFAPKPGYMKGSVSGIQELHPIRGPILRETLVKIVTRQLTPTKALIEFNKSDFMIGHSLYKMDKFRNIATDPFNAGIVEINRQVKYRNENGLHEPLITKEQHYELVRIFDNKPKSQKGPRKNGNPKYPLSNHITHDTCPDGINRFVGFDHGNGQNEKLVYEKYRCRQCGKYLLRDDMHKKVEQYFKKNQITDEAIVEVMQALKNVWKEREGQALQDANRLSHKISELKLSISQHVNAITEPSNANIKDELLAAIDRKKLQVRELEDELKLITEKNDADVEEFLAFGLNFAKNLGNQFLTISPENRIKCKQLLFPDGFYLDKNEKVYTNEISILYRYGVNWSSSKKVKNSHLVRVRGL